MNSYSVVPFGGINFKNNKARLKSGEQPCAICGKAVQRPYKLIDAVKRLELKGGSE